MKLVLAFIASLNLAVGFQGVVPPMTTTSRTAGTSSHLQMGLLDDLFKPKPVPAKKTAKQEAYEAQASTKRRRFKKEGAALWLDKFFSHPVHGHGSDEHSLDDMYEAQQQVLQERQKLFGDGHSVMKNKYSTPGVDHLRDIQTHEHDPAMLNRLEDEAMYIDENDTGFSFPFGGGSNKFTP